MLVCEPKSYNYLRALCVIVGCICISIHIDEDGLVMVMMMLYYKDVLDIVVNELMMILVILIVITIFMMQKMMLIRTRRERDDLYILCTYIYSYALNIWLYFYVAIGSLSGLALSIIVLVYGSRACMLGMSCVIYDTFP